MFISAVNHGYQNYHGYCHVEDNIKDYISVETRNMWNCMLTSRQRICLGLSFFTSLHNYHDYSTLKINMFVV